MKTQITIVNLQKKIPLQPIRLTRIITKILRRERRLGSFLSLVFISDRQIKSLNQKYLKKNHPTDVIAFDLKDNIRLSKKTKICPQKTRALTGEIVISTDAVVKNSKIYKTDFSQELILYILHGILHLSGYDDHRAHDIKRMRCKEQELLHFLKI